MAGPQRAQPPPHAGPGDHVERLIVQWAREQPELDMAPVAVVYRVTRLAAAWQAEIDRLFARFGITNTDFAVLANLRRSGPPYQLTQRQLMSALRLSSGTLSVRTDRLVEQGLVERRPDPDDARATRVTLTAAGHEAFDAVAPAHLANEARLVAALSSEDQRTLARLLRALLVEIEQPDTDRPDRALGLRLLPAHVAMERRASLGLRAEPGLLVEDVEPATPAARAGVAVGDLLVACGDTPLRSLTDLHAALASGAGPRALTARRVNRTVHLTLEP